MHALRLRSKGIFKNYVDLLKDLFKIFEMRWNSNFHETFNHINYRILTFHQASLLKCMSLSLCKISKRVQNLVNAALGKMGKTSLREQKGRL